MDCQGGDDSTSPQLVKFGAVMAGEHPDDGSLLAGRGDPLSGGRELEGGQLALVGGDDHLEVARKYNTGTELSLTLLARLRQSKICSSPVWEWPGEEVWLVRSGGRWVVPG